MSFFRTRAGAQAILIAVLGINVWVISVKNEAFDQIYDFVQKYDAYQLDEIFLAVMVVGLMSLLYSALRVWDLRREISHRNAAEQRARWIAGHDGMTNLLNRRSLDERMASASSSAAKVPLVVFSIDLDGFKEVNDLIGHHAGDEVLRAVAERLKRIFPYEDIFRVGGDEFIAIMNRDGDFNASSVGTRIVTALVEPVLINGQGVEVGASVGYACYPDNGSSLSEVVRCSDVAMYTAKADRHNKVRAFDAVMRERLRERSEMEKSLREAIRADVIIPYYQPIIDLKTGQINGFEALARWENAPNRFVPPITFIELAEQSGLIVELTDRLLRRACSEALFWPENVILSFNISPTQLQDGLLGLRILQILAETGLPPWRLEIEITETALIRDIASAEKILNDLHEARIRIALDDFGTGYSSLAQLSKFSFDKIKIDRGFVSDFGDQRKKEKIMRAIVGLGRGLDILTTAEGIETTEQLNDLMAMGCNLGQGYLFGKALPAEQAIRLFDRKAFEFPLHPSRISA